VGVKFGQTEKRVEERERRMEEDKEVADALRVGCSVCSTISSCLSICLPMSFSTI